MATMTSEPPDVLPASTFEAHAQEPPDVLPATTFESAPDTLPASHFEAPDTLPASTFEHSNATPFEDAYAAQQRANAAGTGGGSPITPREQKNITDAPKALFKGASKLVLKVAQGAEGAAQPFTNPIGALTGTGRFFTEDRTNKMIAGEDTALPTKQSTRNKILETVGGAIPAVAATTVLGPEAAAPIFTGQGGASGFASAEDQNAADVAAGKPVGGATQELRKVGSTLLGAASGYVGGKLADAAGGLPNAAARVAGQGVVGAATGVAENTGQNIIQGRPALQGTGQAAATGGAMGAGLGLGSEVHRALSTPVTTGKSRAPAVADISSESGVAPPASPFSESKTMVSTEEPRTSTSPVSEPPETVRFYHGGIPGEGARWVTPDLKYAQGYAGMNVNDGASVQYIDVPSDHPLLTKSFDDTGTDVKAPYNSFEAPADLMKGAKPVEPPDTLPPEVFEGKANAGKAGSSTKTTAAVNPSISRQEGEPQTALNNQAQPPDQASVIALRPPAASASVDSGSSPEPTPPPVAGQGESTPGEGRGEAVPPPDTAGIAHRVSEARGMEANRGEGISTEDSLERGRELIKQGADPQQVIANHAATGRVSGEDMAVVRAHGEELAKVTNAAADSKGVNSPEYKAAWQAERDWIAKVKPMQTEWHKIGQAQQGETEIDTGTFHGLQRAHFEQSGKDFTEAQAAKAKLVAAKVKDASDAAEASRQKLYQAAGVSEPTPQMKSLADRIVAKLDTAAASALARIKARHANTLTSGIDPADLADLSIYGAAKIAKGVTKFADWSAEMVKDTGEWIKPHLQQVFDASDKRLDKHINDTAGESAPAVRGQIKPTADISAHPPGTKMTPDRVQALWQKAKSDYVEKGVTNFDEIVHKLSIDTGLPVNDIRRGLAQPKGVRQITNDMYNRQSKARELDNNAKRWVQNADTPWPIRAIKAVPGTMFALKVAGHGTVGPVTHAGTQIFSLESPIWVKNFAKGFAMAGSRSYHEQAMQDLPMRENYVMAKRGGLANDPAQMRDDYQSGSISGVFKKLGAIGNRGFDALKLLRQDIFDKRWNKLPESLKTPEMVKGISLSVNHATGSADNPVGNGIVGKTVNAMVFAPKLEASRWGFLIGDPAVAAKRLINWKNETPVARHLAISEIKQKATIAGIYLSSLAINQALLSASGSKDKVNFTDPTKADWLSFKGAGHDIGLIGPMVGSIRFLVQLGMASAGSKKALKGDTRYETVGKDAFKYARGKLSPFGSVATDVVTQSDYQGRPMPFSKDPVPKRLQREGLGKIGYGEYAAQTALPIPLESALKEVWSNQGASQGDIQKWLKAITIAGVSGSTGARVSPDYRQGK